MNTTTNRNDAQRLPNCFIFVYQQQTDFFLQGCAVDIRVENSQGGIDSQQWFVNVDASIPGAVAIQTGATFEYWRIIMGTLDRSPTTRSLVLDSTAQYNIFSITPGLWNFDGYENNAISSNNLFIQIPHQTNTTFTSRTPIGVAAYNAYHQELSMHPFNDGPSFTL